MALHLSVIYITILCILKIDIDCILFLQALLLLLRPVPVAVSAVRWSFCCRLPVSTSTRSVSSFWLLETIGFAHYIGNIDLFYKCSRMLNRMLMFCRLVHGQRKAFPPCVRRSATTTLWKSASTPSAPEKSRWTRFMVNIISIISTFPRLLM